MGYDRLVRFWAKGGVLLVFAVVFIGVLIYKRLPNNPPEEVMAAKATVDKLQTAVEVGVLLPEYNRLLIESQTAVNAAGREARFDMPEVWTAMDAALQAHKDAITVWRTKVSGKKLWGTPEGAAIRWKLKMEASQTEEDVIQECWSIARLKTFELETAIYKYRQGN